jgi:carboxylesterase
MTSPFIPGADPLSHVADGDVGALVLHGFTGNPGSMRGVAEALAAAGFHVEMPVLAGHGTVIEDMLPTRWADWYASAEAAYGHLASRASRRVIVGLSMGGTLTLALGAAHDDVDGLVCINPAAQPQADEVIELLRGMVEGGTEVMPGIGSDIADPSAKESAYEGTPIRPLLSMLQDGVAPLATRYTQTTTPLLLFTSPNDHVVDPQQSDFLAGLYAGPVERVSLDRSFHVATQDYDKDLIFARTIEFARKVTSSS